MIVITVVKRKLGDPEDEAVATICVTNNNLGTAERARYDVENEGPCAPLDAPDSIRGFLRTQKDALDLAAIALRVVARWRDSPLNLDDHHAIGGSTLQRVKKNRWQ